jgi:hypothetical protein
MDSHTPPEMRWMVPLAACSLCLFLGFAAAGCKKPSQATATAVETNIFDLAPPELKEAWGTALGAAQTNDYATACITLAHIRRQAGLNEAQHQAIDAESTVVNARMNEAAQKGDSNALKAIQDIRAASRPHGR